MKLDSDIEITVGEMVLDMDNFDFSMIDDETSSEPEVIADPEVVEDTDETSDLVDDEEETSEEETEEEEEVEEETSEEDTEEDTGEEVVDYESYSISLPSGEEVVLADLVKGFKAAEEVAAERAKLEEVKADFESKVSGMDKYLSLAKLEADRVIEDYEDFDWAGIAKEDPQAYVEHREFLDKYKSRKAEIAAAMTAMEERKAAEEQRLTDAKAQEANAVLVRDIPNWGKEAYEGLVRFAVEKKGFDQDFVLNCLEPSFFLMLHKNREIEEGKQSITAKVKRANKAPTKVIKSTKKDTVKTTVDVKKQAVLKKIEKGNFAEAFDFLED